MRQVIAVVLLCVVSSAALCSELYIVQLQEIKQQLPKARSQHEEQELAAKLLPLACAAIEADAYVDARTILLYAARIFGNDRPRVREIAKKLKECRSLQQMYKKIEPKLLLLESSINPKASKDVGLFYLFIKGSRSKGLAYLLGATAPFDELAERLLTGDTDTPELLKTAELLTKLKATVGPVMRKQVSALIVRTYISAWQETRGEVRTKFERRLSGAVGWFGIRGRSFSAKDLAGDYASSSGTMYRLTTKERDATYEPQRYDLHVSKPIPQNYCRWYLDYDRQVAVLYHIKPDMATAMHFTVGVKNRHIYLYNCVEYRGDNTSPSELILIGPPVR